MTKKLVQVVDYDPDWPSRFEALRAKLWPDLAKVALAIEHVGSTSVPGLAAKPIIDAAIVVETRGDLPAVIAVLAEHGYGHRGDLGVTGRESFRQPADMFKHHLYACAQDNLGLRNHLVLRDALRADASLAREYGDLKRGLAERFAYDIDGYIAGKTEFILGVLRNAGFTDDDLSEIRAVNT
ncbi:MAG: GrpB family protein [Planctomycetota bacterium]